MNIVQSQFNTIRIDFNNAKRKFKGQSQEMTRLHRDVHMHGIKLATKKSSPSQKFAHNQIKVEQKKLVREFNEIKKNRSVLGRKVSKYNGTFKSSNKKVNEYVENNSFFKKSLEKRTEAANNLINKLTPFPEEINGKANSVNIAIQALNEKTKTIRLAAQNQMGVLEVLHTLNTSLTEFEQFYTEEISKYADAEKNHPDLAFARARLVKIRKEIIALEEQARSKNAFEDVFCTITEDPSSYLNILNQLTELKYELESKQLFVQRHLSDGQRILREPTWWENFRGIQLTRTPAPETSIANQEDEVHAKIGHINQEIQRIRNQINQYKNTINEMVIGGSQKGGALAYLDGKLQRIGLLEMKVNETNTLNEMLDIPQGQPFPMIIEIERELAAIEHRLRNHVQKLNPPAVILGIELEKNRKLAERRIEEFIDTENIFYLDGIKQSISCLHILSNYVNTDVLFEVEAAYKELEKAQSDFNEKLQEIQGMDTLEAKVQGLHDLFQSEEYSRYAQELLDFSIYRVKLEGILTSLALDQENHARYLAECSTKLSVIPENCFIQYIQRPPRHTLLMTELFDLLPRCELMNLDVNALKNNTLDKNKALAEALNTKRNKIELELYIDKLNIDYPNGVTYKQYVNLLLYSASAAFNPQTSKTVRARLDALLRKGIESKGKGKNAEKIEQQFKEQKMKAIYAFYRHQSKKNSNILQTNFVQCDLDLKEYLLGIANNPLEIKKNLKFIRKFEKAFGLN